MCSVRRQVGGAHLVSRRKVGYLPNGNVNHDHHVSAVEDVCGLSAGKDILQKLEDRVRRGRRVVEHAHGVVWTKTVQSQSRCKRRPKAALQGKWRSYRPCSGAAAPSPTES